MKNLKELTGSTKPLYPEVKGITGLSTGLKGLKGITGIPIIRIKKKVYIHYIYQFGCFRFSFYRLGNKFSIRFSIEKGWD